MKGRIALVVALATFAGSAAVARADDKSEIRSLYAKARQAFMKRDVNGVIALGTADFSEKEKDGKVFTADQSKQMMEQQFAMIKSVKSCTMKADKITVKGKSATVVSSFSMLATMVDKMGQMGPKGNVHTMKDSGTSKDTLVKTPQGWKMKTRETLSESAALDGKPFNPGGPPPTK